MNKQKDYTQQDTELRAAEFYAGIRKPENEWKSIVDLEPQLREFEHRVRAGDYSGACRVLRIIDCEYLLLWGHYAYIVELRQGVIGKVTDPLLDMENKGSLGHAYRALGQFEKAAELYKKALLVAREINDHQNEGVWLGYLGLAHRGQGRYRQAIEYYEQALNIAEKTNDRSREGIWLGNLGRTHRVLGKFEQSIEMHKQALEIAREMGNRREEGIELGHLGSAYRELGYIEEAIVSYQSALIIAQEIRSRHEESFQIGRLGMGYHLLGDFEKSIKCYQEALKISRETGEYSGVGEGIWIGFLADAYKALGKFEHAVNLYKKALNIAQKINDLPMEGVWSRSLGDIYTVLNMFELSDSLYKKSLNIASKTGSRKTESYSLLGLGKISLVKEDLVEAQQYFSRSIALNVPEISYGAALFLGVVLLYQDDPATKDAFMNAARRCKTMLEKTENSYGPHYALATTLIGQAICNPNWTATNQRSNLLAPAMTEYRRALAITSAHGVVRAALCDLELIRAAGIEGLEPAFELLEGVLNEQP